MKRKAILITALIVTIFLAAHADTVTLVIGNVADAFNPPVTVATLPAFAAAKYQVRVISDANPDCGTGGGTGWGLCFSDGTAWRTLGAGGGGGSTTAYYNYLAAACQDSNPTMGMSYTSAEKPTPTCFAGSNVEAGLADFADSGTFAVQGDTIMPASYTTATLDFVWITSVTNTALAAVWQVQFNCVGDGDAVDTAYGTAQKVTSNAKNAASKEIVATITVTGTSCAGKTLQWRAFRDPTDVNDTLAATARLKKVRWGIQ